MKLTTWNVNSINARIDHLIKFISKDQSDIYLIQELKCGKPVSKKCQLPRIKIRKVRLFLRNRSRTDSGKASVELPWQTLRPPNCISPLWILSGNSKFIYLPLCSLSKMLKIAKSSLCCLSKNAKSQIQNILMRIALLEINFQAFLLQSMDKLTPGRLGRRPSLAFVWRQFR